MSSLTQAESLTKSFVLGSGWPGKKAAEVRAVEEVDLCLSPGGRLAIVGESGCGKSTLGRLLVGLTPPTSGRVLFQGVDLRAFKPRQWRAVRRQLQMVFQDATGSLNPRLRIGALLAEALKLQASLRLSARLEALLHRVGLEPTMASRFPHQLSGGQRQRVAIARALACDPLLLVADEAVAGLDASLKVQVVRLLSDLVRERQTALVFITHDLALVPFVAERVAVMYAGRLVELAVPGKALEEAQHPYTRALFAAMPRLIPGRERPSLPQGEPPDPLRPPQGCAFHPRCPLAQARCRVERPVWRETLPGQFVACHFPGAPPSEQARPAVPA